MKENSVDINAVPKAEAIRLTAENKYGGVWPAGLYVIIDNQRAVLESREEAENLIAEIAAAADQVWPVGS